MKILKFTFILFGVLITLNTSAQNEENPNSAYVSKFKVSVGAGTANYYGDLMKKNSILRQTSPSFSAGISYTITNNIAARLDVGILQLKGADSKPSGAHKSRNLSFKSNVFDFAISGEYTILNLDNFMLSPYLSAGVGVVFFSPYAEDALGNRQSLPELGTEGQGLAGYPGHYNQAALIFPLGVGVKYPFNKNITLALDVNYRITRTDYLDDVSTGYPDKVLLDARNPVTAKYTWRGNEVGSGSFPPKNNTLPRGNPKDNDGYYIAQAKLIFKL